MDPLAPAGTPATEAETFELVYRGPDVEDGTMGARELAEVLAGVSRAFSTVASESDLGDRYQLRIKDVESKSFHVILKAIEYAKANPAPATAMIAATAVALQGLTAAISGAYRIIIDIAKLIDAKKRAKGRRVALLPTAFADGRVTLTVDDDLIVLTREQYEILLSRGVDRQLSQIVSPLEPKKIDRFEMRRSNAEMVTVEASQRDYFNYVEAVEEKSKEGTEIVGTLNSLNKTNLRGTFFTLDGVHVPYRYSGGDVAQLLRGFSTREPVRVHGQIKYGADGVPTFVDARIIEVLQSRLFES
jgi:hypothetical protein